MQNRQIRACICSVIALVGLSANIAHAQGPTVAPLLTPNLHARIPADDVVIARTSSPLTRLVSVSLQDVPLRDALRAVKSAASVNLIYRVESIPNRRVTLDSTTRTLGATLQTLLRDTGLEFRQSSAGDIIIAPPSNRDAPSVAVARLQAVSVLGQKVVAGTMISTTRREVPNAVTIITGDMLRAQGVRTVDQLFRGLVPGIVAFDQGSDVNAIGTAALQVRGTAGFTSLNMPLKTYVDGIEMSDPTFINHIEAKSIDRIEISLGPQASTLYGAGALSGVMQITTKRGRTTKESPSWRPDISATLSAGWLSGKGNSLAPVQDHAINIAGGLPRYSYNLAGGYAFDGAHSSGSFSTASSRNAFGTAAGRVHLGSITPTMNTGGTADIDGTFRLNQRRFGASDDQFYTQGRATGILAYNPYRIVPYNRPGSVRERTTGLSIAWDVAPWMRHSLVVGEDQQVSDFASSARFTSAADTLPSFDHGNGARGTLAYNATFRGTMRDVLSWTVTAGADGWQYNYNSMYAGVTRNSAIAFDSTSPDGGFIARYNSYQRNIGYFVQSQFGWRDELFVTTGVRVEPSLRRDENNVTPVLPRFGLSYVREALDGLSFKLRGSFGRAARPVCPSCQGGGVTPFAIVLANDRLRGETQTGGEIGFDIYTGRRASLEVTYFQQTGSDFIVAVRTSAFNESPVTYEYRNGGKTRNRGIELHSSLRTGPLTFAGTYTYTDARLQHAGPALPGGLRAGDRAMFVAPIASSLNVTYSISKARVMLGSSYVASYRDFVDSVLSNTPVGGVPTTQSITTVVESPSHFRLYANGSVDVFDRAQLFLQGDNLNNAYGLSVSRNVAGRRMMLGLRLGSP